MQLFADLDDSLSDEVAFFVQHAHFHGALAAALNLPTHSGHEHGATADGFAVVLFVVKPHTQTPPVVNGVKLFKRILSLPADQQSKIRKTKLTIYECDGSETEIKDWFETINIKGIEPNKQERLNAIFSGPFVTLAKAEFSNSQLAMVIPTSKKPKPQAAEVDALLASAALTPKMNWEQLRVLTREP